MTLLYSGGPLLVLVYCFVFALVSSDNVIVNNNNATEKCIQGNNSTENCTNGKHTIKYIQVVLKIYNKIFYVN